MPLPETADSFLQSGLQFWRELQTIKETTPAPEPGWYPYETLSALPIVSELVAPVYDEIREATAAAPMLDIGSGDGDFAMFFASFGIPVDAVDSTINNFNKMRGIAKLCDCLHFHVHRHDMDLDEKFSFPSSAYGLSLLLGTLYHLKNPYYLLEKLAYSTRWCILSTRIAQLTPRERVTVENEPVAYLADGQEFANDSTNYWIFSPAGLLRLARRTRWAVIAHSRIGCLTGSTPTEAAADERMFLLLRSRVHAPSLQVRPIAGWYAAEPRNQRWTEKHFSLQLILPLDQPVTGFEFSFYVPAAASVEWSIGGEPATALIVDQPGPAVLRANISVAAVHLPILIADFHVTSVFSAPAPDIRELGICVNLSEGFPLRAF
jgi:tRNA (mo5U34)-methyltransferase